MWEALSKVSRTGFFFPLGMPEALLKSSRTWFLFYSGTKKIESQSPINKECIGREHPYVLEAAPVGGLSDLVWWWLGSVATIVTFYFGIYWGCIRRQRHYNVEALTGLSLLC